MQYIKKLNKNNYIHKKYLKIKNAFNGSALCCYF